MSDEPVNQETPQDHDVWLSVVEYAKKYGLTQNRIQHLKIKGRLIFKQIDGVLHILDVPLDQHPTTEEDRLPPERKPPKGNRPKSKYAREEERKQALREKFLPIFLEKAPPERMCFTATELLRLFSISQPTLHRDWRKWGLVARPVPEEYKHLSDVPMTGEFMYTRRDIVRFLKGEWEPPEKGTPDDIVIGATEGVQALDGQYYKYDPEKVYPLDAESFFAWLEDVDLKVENKRLRKWMPYKIWSVQRESVIEGLKLTPSGDFQHKLFAVSWPRGEGKTLLVCILTLFFFFNGYGEVITLAGNTRDQSKFTHYDLCKSIIQHTPKLMATPGLEIKEKYIALKTGPKEMFNRMEAIPTSVGLLPGTTRAVFTELHNLQDTKFFYDLWTSLRNVPNAMVLIDTTVARPGHLVHNLWQTYRRGDDPLIYFHHYSDKHYNPEMTPQALNHFRQTLPEVLFNMYFRNRWEDAAGSLFPIEKIREIKIQSLDGKLAPAPELTEAMKKLMDLEHKRNTVQRGKLDIAAVNQEIAAVERRIIPVDKLYRLPASIEDLEKISKTYGCNFIIGVGLDRALRMSKNPGRTVMSCVARGLINQETSIYFVLDIFIPNESTLPVLADKFMEWTGKYGWIDKVAVETFSGEDFYNWAADKALAAEFVSPTFSKQKPVFFSMSNIIDNGYLKCPAVPYYTDEDGNIYRGFSNKEDVFREELAMFNYVPGITEKTGWFGSPEKNKKSGVQDDVVYSVGWAIYATNGEDMVAAGNRGGAGGAIEAVVNRDVVGDYR